LPAVTVSLRAASAQGVTTGVVTGVVLNQQRQGVAGATVIAVHEPSGTVYETVTRADGRFSIPAMRLGGPYLVSVNHTGSGPAFAPENQSGIQVNLGVTTDLAFNVRPIALQEAVTVSAEVDPVFSSSRTGASTSLSRLDIATLPTVTGRIGDLVRLTPQASGLSIAGQDNRLNNITVDGSYFNNSFGLGGQPGDRTGVAPISLESIEQIQVNVAPYDVRQGNFIGANVNTVTRSGTNRFAGSAYYRFRNQDFVGTKAKTNTFNPGTFETKQTGMSVGGPLVKNKLFFFVNFENEKDSRPLNSFRANAGGEAVGGSVTRVLASDLTAIRDFLQRSFQYDTGSFDPSTDETPQKRFLVRADYNLSRSQKVSVRYSQLDSSSDVNLSGSTSAGFGRPTFTTNFLNFQGSNYNILENIKSGIGEWNSVIGNSMSNSLIVGFTSNDESREGIDKLFPFIDIQDGNQVGYTAVGSEPFTPNNELRYKTFQIKNDFTKFGAKHSLTFGFAAQKYRSENVFFGLRQSGYTYNTLADFYTDLNGYLANPNRTTSPVTLRRFQVRYMNLPGLDTPLQPLEVWYSGGYAQDEWRPRGNFTVMAGLRFDVSRFGDTGFPNAKADALTFRDEAGQAVSYKSGELPSPKVLWSPRVGFNWDVRSDQKTQVRGGTGVFSGQPLYVWVSNQIGQTGVLTGFDQFDSTTTRPFNPDPNRYKPAIVAGATASSYELNVTDPSFKFPQVWRSNIAVDHRLPGGIVGGVEFIYNKDVNGIYYINANLPAAQSAFTGVDNRPRWTGTACGSGTAGPCVNRINNQAGNQVTSAIVMKNQNVGSSWNLAATLSKSLYRGVSVRGAYSYGESRNTIDPGSTALASFTGNPHRGDPNNPGLGVAGASPGHRLYVQASYSKEYFAMGATTVSAFWETRTIGNTSYVFAGDMNGDGGSNSDLIYIPRDTSEMNFVQFTAAGRTWTAAEQAAAFEAYILQDPYLRQHRGQYAERGAVFLPRVTRMDVSLTQDVFKNVGGRRNAGQFRIDVLNFGNMLNSNWGVSQRIIQTQLLTNAAADAQGRVSYRLNTFNNDLLRQSYQSTSGLADVYSFMLSFRYSFN
jgi:hypothetical protein